MSENISTMKVAVLIDAENISPAYAQLILNEAARIGNVVCKRIYGDWSSPSLATWKKPIMDFSISAIQQFHNTSGKNSSDSALIIDAMDLLYEKKYQGICIVSSDSDFTRLASRLREAEIYVVGMGEQKTPVSLRSACDRFLYLDVLMSQEKEASATPAVLPVTPASAKEPTVPAQEVPDSGLDINAIVNAINDIIDSSSDEDGWVHLGTLGNMLMSKFSDFDVRNFGYKKLSDLLGSFDLYELKSVPSPGSSGSCVIYIRKKK